MNDALSVGGIQSVRNFDGQTEQDFSLKTFAQGKMLQRHATEKFHRDERFALLFANVENCANVWVTQGRGSLRIALEKRQSYRDVSNLQRQDFQRNETTKASVFCLVDDSHAATTKLFEHGVVGDRATDDGRSVWHSLGSLSQPSNAGKRRTSREFSRGGYESHDEWTLRSRTDLVG